MPPPDTDRNAILVTANTAVAMRNADGPCPPSYLRPMPNWGAADQTEVMESQS